MNFRVINWSYDQGGLEAILFALCEGGVSQLILTLPEMAPRLGEFAAEVSDQDFGTASVSSAVELS